MTDSAIEKELAAIKTITNALESFEPDARRRVLQYATQHLGIAEVPTGETPTIPSAPGGTGDESQVLRGGSEHNGKMVDIRTFKEEKNPTSDVQMAAVVAYYLAELAPEDRRKDAIATDDIVTYFKQAGYKLPAQPKDTLPHAKTAGYFDTVARGAYKLNPVGHNLVVHTLPGQAGERGPQTRRRKGSPKKGK